MVRKNGVISNIELFLNFEHQNSGVVLQSSKFGRRAIQPTIGGSDIWLGGGLMTLLVALFGTKGLGEDNWKGYGLLPQQLWLPSETVWQHLCMRTLVLPQWTQSALWTGGKFWTEKFQLSGGRYCFASFLVHWTWSSCNTQMRVFKYSQA